MSDRDIDALPPDVVALLDAERSRPNASEDAEARALRRFEVALTVGMASAPHVGGTDAGTGTAPPPAGSLGRGAEVKVGAKVVAAVATKPAIALLSVIGGAALGAGAHAQFAREAPRVVYVDRIVTVPEAPPASVPVPVDAAAPPVEVQPTVPPAAVSRAPATPARDPSMASERLLLEAARTALARGDSSSALNSLERHAAKYPHGHLEEEREAMLVQALVAAGRPADAKLRASRFHEHFPSSMLAGAVDAAISSIP